MKLESDDTSPYDYVIIGAGVLGRYSYYRLNCLFPHAKIAILDGSRFISELQTSTEVNSNIGYQGNSIRHSLLHAEGTKAWGGAMMPWPTELLSWDESFSTVCNRFDLQFTKSVEEIGIYSFDRIDAQVLKNIELSDFFDERCILHALVTNIEKTSSDSYKVVFELENGSIKSVTSKAIFLAAGTIENTRLLFQSIQLIDEVSRHNLGQGLSDHLSISLGTFHINILNRRLRRFLKYSDLAGNEVWPRLVDTQNPNCHYFLHFRSIEQDAKVVPILSILHKVFFRIGFRKVEALLFLEKVSGNSYIAMPKDKLFIHFQLSESELSNIKSLRNDLKKVLVKGLGIKFFKFRDVSDEKDLLPLISDTLHPAGTIRSSNNPDVGVTNPKHQINGSKGVYVLGAATFERSSATHPTFTALCEAEALIQNLV